MIEPAMQDLLVLLSDPAAWLALVTLVVMEVVLGIDNLIFISILTNKLPPENREKARKVGIGLALVMRLALLGTVAWISASPSRFSNCSAKASRGRTLSLLPAASSWSGKRQRKSTTMSTRSITKVTSSPNPPHQALRLQSARSCCSTSYSPSTASSLPSA